jgi:hypothetical protein
LRILHHFRALTLGMLIALIAALSSVFKTRAALQLENLALRHLSFAKNGSGNMSLRCNAFITMMQTAELWDLDNPSDS